MNFKSLKYAWKHYSLKSIAKTLTSLWISDVVVVSFRKSGRTWLRLMYAKALQEEYNYQKIRLDTQYMTFGKKQPNVLFSHGGTTKDNNKLNFQKLYHNKKILFLVRDPRAVIVSLYYDYTRRHKRYEGDLSSFIRSEIGLKQVITFLNTWAQEIKKRDDVCVITYENLYLDGESELKKMFDFLGVQVSKDCLQKAIEYGSAKNMRKMELNKTFNDQRMLPGDVNDIQSYRTRKCKLGSFREELSAEDLAYATQLIEKELDPLYGYPHDERY